MRERTSLDPSFHNSYQIFGSGKRLFIAYHGFGQSSAAMRGLSSPERQVFSFDLFYHNNNQAVLKLENWKQQMAKFIDQNQIEEVNIVGFSLGSRPAVKLAELILEETSLSINSIHLIAPEVLAVSTWYKFATQTLLGKQVLNKLSDSHRLKSIILTLSGRLYGGTSHRIIDYQVRQRMTLLSNTWQAYRYFRINADAFSEISQQTDVHVYFSKKDRFVESNKIKSFVGESFVRWHEIPLAHHQLLWKALEMI